MVARDWADLLAFLAVIITWQVLATNGIFHKLMGSGAQDLVKSVVPFAGIFIVGVYLFQRPFFLTWNALNPIKIVNEYENVAVRSLLYMFITYWAVFYSSEYNGQAAMKTALISFPLSIPFTAFRAYLNMKIRVRNQLFDSHEYLE